MKKIILKGIVFLMGLIVYLVIIILLRILEIYELVCRYITDGVYVFALFYFMHWICEDKEE